jgi:uncharacterized membrane protein
MKILGQSIESFISWFIIHTIFRLKWKYFLLGISFICWGILSICTLGMGFLSLVQYATSTLAAFYNEHIVTKKQVISSISPVFFVKVIYGGKEPY